MKYVRTDDGIYEFKEECMSISKGIYYLFGKLEETSKDYLFKNDLSLGKVISQSDDLRDLCDVFANVSDYAGTISFNKYLDFEKARCNKSDDATLYGYIYITLSNGAIRMEPIAKMNNKGDLELL